VNTWRPRASRGRGSSSGTASAKAGDWRNAPTIATRPGEPLRPGRLAFAGLRRQPQGEQRHARLFVAGQPRTRASSGERSSRGIRSSTSVEIFCAEIEVREPREPEQHPGPRQAAAAREVFCRGSVMRFGPQYPEVSFGLVEP